MDVQQAVLAGMFGQRHFGEIDGRKRGAGVAVADQFLGDFDADVLLRLFRAAADVRRQDHVFDTAQRRHELVACAFGLFRENVDGRAGQMVGLSAAARASISTTVPRDALISIDPAACVRVARRRSCSWSAAFQEHAA